MNSIQIARELNDLYGTELTERLLMAVTVEEYEWREIANAPRHVPLRLFAPALIREDFNPSGSVEGYWQDDDGWVGAVWNSCHDCWDRQKISPTHYMLLPKPPAIAQWEIASRSLPQS